MKEKTYFYKIIVPSLLEFKNWSIMINKPYDLEERTFLFANECRTYIRTLPKTTSNIEDGKQLVRSSGSVGANYIEANEKLGDKDLIFRLKISRKEAKESKFWLRLLHESNPDQRTLSNSLLFEVEELRKILSAIITKTSK
ncbi:MULTISPECIES: four helix bundle protein [unclassified Flavobacterium]|uniref:four helix bundle protein n=1 Tax=unclassified Flavobacterium TaxID=196869 RepID=UPI001F0B0109|nr:MULTISPECIES: four helix bundle protein [unclassified Flavobacterium]MEA9413933.1 four helix bundle protein [Flavobacterium sp. PL02]